MIVMNDNTNSKLWYIIISTDFHCTAVKFRNWLKRICAPPGTDDTAHTQSGKVSDRVHYAQCDTVRVQDIQYTAKSYTLFLLRKKTFDSWRPVDVYMRQWNKVIICSGTVYKSLPELRMANRKLDPELNLYQNKHFFFKKMHLYISSTKR